MLRYLSITTLFRVRQASHFPDEFLLIPALFAASFVLRLGIHVSTALCTHIEHLTICFLADCSDARAGMACPP